MYSHKHVYMNNSFTKIFKSEIYQRVMFYDFFPYNNTVLIIQISFSYRL